MHLIIKPFFPILLSIHSGSNVPLGILYSNFPITVSATVPLISSQKYLRKSLKPIFCMVRRILLCFVLLAKCLLFLLEFSPYSAAVNY